MRKVMVAVWCAALVLSGCQGESGGTERIARAAAQTRAAKTSKVGFSLSGLPGTSGSVVADGAFDYDADRGAYSMTLPPISGQSLGQLDFVQDGLVLYAQFPPALAQVIGAKQWVKIDIQALSKTSAGANLDRLSQARAADPTQPLAFLRGARGAKRRGTDTIRGVRATHYRTTVDLNRAADRSPADQRKALKDAAAALGTSTFPADIWLDVQDRVRRMRYSVDLSKVKVPTAASNTTRPSGTETFTFELYDFGTAVKADVPPPDQVTDLQELLQRFASGVRVGPAQP